MAALTSVASGNWNTAGTWSPAQVPTAADDVTGAAGHTITLNSASCVAKTATINGTLNCITSANTALTVQDWIYITASGNLATDVSSTPTFTCSLKLNAARTGNFETYLHLDEVCTVNAKGYPRTRKTTLVSGISAGATSATATSATGWQVGDKIVLATTEAYNATPRTDVVTINTVNTGTGAFTWTGGTTYAHAAGGYVGNFTSNMIITPATAGDGAWVWYETQYGSTYQQKTFQDVLFLSMGGDPAGAVPGALGFYGGNAGAGNDIKFNVTNSAFDDFRASGILFREFAAACNTTNTIFYTANANSNNDNGDNAAIAFMRSTAYNPGTYDGIGVLRVTGSQNGFGIRGLAAGLELKNSFISGCKTMGWNYQVSGGTVTDVEIFSNALGVKWQAGDLTATRLNNGTFNGGAATNGTADEHGTLVTATLTDCNTQGLALSNLGSALTPHKITYVNKNTLLNSQEIYRPFMTIKRSTNSSRGTSSVEITPTKTATNCQRTLSIPLANGQSCRIIGRVQKSHATNISATVAVAGLGTAWGGFTKANDTAWQEYDTGVLTNSSGADGNLTLTYTANSSSGTTNFALFDGVYDPPFVVKTRHYGYLFDNSPTRTVNTTISASESTAAAYTDVTVTWGTGLSTSALAASSTFQKLYDGTQAQAVLSTNQNNALPLEGVGVVGGISLFAKGALTTAGYTLNGPGSIGMGSFTLTANQPWSYTYTGGTFSQLTTVPGFNGGQLNIGAAGTFTFNGTSLIVSMTPTAPGTYALGGGSFAGTIDLRNTSAHAITVQVPAGTTTTTASNTGGTITVSAATATLTIDANVSLVGAEIRIYDLDNSPAGSLGTELSGTESAPSSTYAYSGTAGNSVWLQIMLAGYEEFGQSLTLPSVSTTFTAQLKVDSNA